MVAVVEGYGNGSLGAGEEQPLSSGIFPNRIDGRSSGQSRHDRRPGLATVAGAVDPRLEFAQTQGVDRGIRGEGIEVGGVDQRHLGPRFEGRRGHVLPGPAAVHGDVDQTVIASGPEDVLAEIRRRHGVDDTGMASDCGGGRGVLPDAGRNKRVGPGQVRADPGPVPAAVQGLPHGVGGEVQRAGIDRREQHWCRPQRAIVRPAEQAWPDFLNLAGAAVVPGHLAAVDQIGIQRIGRDVAVFLDPHRMPFAEGDLPVIAAARDARRAALLLAAADAVGKGIVGGDVIELGRGLVVPGAPGLAAVHGNDGALVGGDQRDVRVVGVDPDAVVVVTARRTA